MAAPCVIEMRPSILTYLSSPSTTPIGAFQAPCNLFEGCVESRKRANLASKVVLSEAVLAYVSVCHFWNSRRKHRVVLGRTSAAKVSTSSQASRKASCALFTAVRPRYLRLRRTENGVRWCCCVQPYINCTMGVVLAFSCMNAACALQGQRSMQLDSSSKSHHHHLWNGASSESACMELLVHGAFQIDPTTNLS